MSTSTAPVSTAASLRPVAGRAKPRRRRILHPLACQWCGPGIRNGHNSTLGGLGTTRITGRLTDKCVGHCTPADVWDRLANTYSWYTNSTDWGLGSPVSGSWTTCPERVMLSTTPRMKGRPQGVCQVDCPSRSLLERMSTIRDRILAEQVKRDDGSGDQVGSVLAGPIREQSQLRLDARQRAEYCRSGHYDYCSTRSSGGKVPKRKLDRALH